MNNLPFKFFRVIFTFTVLISCESDKENRYFIKTYDFGKTEQALSMTINEKGETIIGGYTSSFMTSTDALVMKITPSGDIMWMKTFGNTGFDLGIDIINTNDQNTLLTGKVFHNNKTDIFILKVNDLGQLIWSKYLDLDKVVDPYRVYPDGKDGFYLTAYDNADMKIIKFSFLGDTTWVKTIGKFKGYDFGRSLYLKSNGHILLCGNSNSLTSHQNPFVMELDQSGNELWTSIIELPEIYFIYDMAVIESEGIYLVGNDREDFNANDKAVMIKTNMAGRMLWRKGLNYPSDKNVYYDIEITQRKELLLCGYARTTTQLTQFLLAKATTDGDLIWARTYGNNGEECAYRAKELPNGDIISVGTTTDIGAFYSNIMVIKVNKDGIIP